MMRTSEKENSAVGNVIETNGKIQDKIVELDDSLFTKGVIFKFFALLFLPPTDERISKMKIISENLKGELPIFDEILKLNFDEDVKADYTMLFRAGFDPVHPYEGAYINPNMVPILHIKLSEEYLKEGFVEKDGDFPDHISTLLEFVSILYFKGKKEKAYDFLKKHFWWINHFTKKIEKKCKGDIIKSQIYLIGAKSLYDYIKKILNEGKDIKEENEG